MGKNPQLHRQVGQASISVVCGCVNSGKTEELIRRIHQAMMANRKVQVFKSHINLQGSVEQIRTYHGVQFRAIPVPWSHGRELKNRVQDETNIVAIDDVQFFDLETVSLCEELVAHKIEVVVAGFDCNFRGEPFSETILELLARAENLTKLSAKCVICGDAATHTQRLVNGQPARWNELPYLVGAKDEYQPRCRTHHHIVREETIQLNNRHQKTS